MTVIKIQSTIHTEAPKLDKSLVHRFNELKKEHDRIDLGQQERIRQMVELREQILKQLPGKESDKVELDVDGIIVNKTVRDSSGGKLKGKAALMFAKTKRMLRKVAQKQWVLDQKAFDKEISELIKEGKLTPEQYDAMIERKWTPVLTVSEKRPSEDSIKLAK